jgi:uncharacterized protein (TIGR02246 family)
MTRVRTAGSPAELDAIGRVRQAHVAALNRGDVEAWAELFSEDGVQMPPHVPANVGRPAIRAWSEGFLAPFHVDFALDVDEVRVGDEWAFERGRYAIALTPKGGGPPIGDRGKYVTVYLRRARGSWQMGRDIWNSDAPPETVTTPRGARG